MLPHNIRKKWQEKELLRSLNTIGELERGL